VGGGSLVFPVLAALVLHVILLAITVVKHRDISFLICVSKDAVGVPPYEAVRTGSPVYGADGMWYYALARDPWRLHESFDYPANRHLRIVYPLACWLLSGGDNPVLLAWVMPAVNLLAIAGIAWLGAWMAKRHGQSPWWGFALTLAVNAALPALRDLTDVVSTLGVLGLLVAWLSGASAMPLALWGAVALFGREQNAVVVFLVQADCLLKRRYRAAGGLASVLAGWGAWVTVLRLAYGEWPFLPTGGNFSPPLGGLIDGWNLLVTAHYHRRMRLFLLLSLLHATVLMGVGLVAVQLFLRTSREGRPCHLLAVFTLMGVLLAILAGPSIFCDIHSYRRVLVWHSLGIWLLGIQTGRSWLLWSVGLSGIWSVAGGLGYI